MRSRERHHWGFRKLRPPGARVCVADSEFERQTAARHSLLRSGLRGWDSNADSRLQRRLCSPAYTTPEGRPTKYRVADSGRQNSALRLPAEEISPECSTIPSNQPRMRLLRSVLLRTEILRQPR